MSRIIAEHNLTDTRLVGMLQKETARLAAEIRRISKEECRNYGDPTTARLLIPVSTCLLLEQYADTSQEVGFYETAAHLFAAEVQVALTIQGRQEQPQVSFKKTWFGFGRGKLIATNL